MRRHSADRSEKGDRRTGIRPADRDASDEGADAEQLRSDHLLEATVRDHRAPPTAAPGTAVRVSE